MGTNRHIKKAGIALAAIVVVVILAAVDISYAQPAKKGSAKESLRMSVAIKQYCSARWGGNRNRIVACVAGEEAARQRLDKRSTDPKIKSYCTGVVRAGEYSLVEKCISSLEKPKPKRKPMSKGRVVQFPDKKAQKASVPEKDSGRRPHVGPANDGKNPVR